MAARPFFSIIIPYHNSSKTIEPLLSSIVLSKFAPPLEVIVVDDGSSSNSKFESLTSGRNSNQKRTYKKLHVKTIVLLKNKGPAVARNRGAALAKGKFLVFLDADVTLFPDALHNLGKLFLEDQDVVAATGVWVKEQQSKAFFPNFKALRDWSYWINERDRSGYYFLFSTRIAAVKKSVFLRLHGFDEKYAGPLVEDIEFTYRIARRYAVIFAPNVRVHHEFEGFWPIARKYFWRTFYWKRLYDKRKRFDPVATTGKEAVTSVTGVGAVLFALFSAFLYIIIQYRNISYSYFIESLLVYSSVSSSVLFLLHMFLNRTFLLFAAREKGTLFAFKSLFVGIVLYCFILAGVFWAEIRKIRET